MGHSARPGIQALPALLPLLVLPLALSPAHGGGSGGSTVAPEGAGDGQHPPLWRIAERMIELRGLDRPADQVLEHMARVLDYRRGVVGRLSRVDRALVEPWTPPELAADLRSLLASPVETRGGPRFAALWPGIADWLDLAEPGEVARAELEGLERRWRDVADPERTGAELLAALSALMGEAHLILEGAIEELGDRGRSLLFERHADFREAWYRDHFPDTEQTVEQKKTQEAVIGGLLADPRTDPRRMLGVAAVLARLGERDFRQGLARRLRRVEPGEGGLGEGAPGFGGDLLAVVGESPAERVVLGGRGPTTYAGPAALVIDLGGADTYQRAAVVDGEDMLASVVLDLAGDDVYGGAEGVYGGAEGVYGGEAGAPGPASAVGGVALVFDARGDDTYRSGRLGQGAATLGVALLADLEGDDTYVMEDYGQGHALCGVALLVDLAGDDTYQAWAYAQGGGLGYGLSALVDGEGDDRYLADLHWPDVYGNSGPEIYHGASQGYCSGLRPAIAGGIGALVDLGRGADRYQSGNFSQGGGYYFSFGLMYDGGGDDENFGTRYSQGFGVHQAAAVRWDAGGDDVYNCRSVAHAGMGWDEGVGYFLEDGGDDVYRVGGLALGGAAQTAVAVFLDRDGRDSYRSGGQAQGGNGGFEYHDKPSLALMIDLGGDRDDYSEPGREDGALLATEGVGLFLDSRARTLERALKGLR